MAVERYSLASSLKEKEELVMLEVVLKRKIQIRESTRLLTYGLTNFDLVEISKSDKPFNSVILARQRKYRQSLYKRKYI